MRRATVALFGVTVLLMTSPAMAPAAGSAPDSTPAPRAKIVLIVLENHAYGSINGSVDAPYLNSIASQYVKFTQYNAVCHPSVSNYLAMTAGDTFGKCGSDSTSVVHAENVFDQLSSAGISWKTYAEQWPSPCYTGRTSGAPPHQYALRHTPAMLYDDVRSTALCNNVVDFSQLSADVAAGTLPGFSYVVPDLCDDMHSCPIATADAWLSQNVPGMLDALAGTNGVLVITFDESKGSDSRSCCGLPPSAGGRVLTLIAGPGARTTTKIATPVDHYSLLRLLEDNWSLAPLSGAATAPEMAGWQS